jgi:hypothetical protein
MSRAERSLAWVAVLLLLAALAITVYLANVQVTQQAFDLGNGVPWSFVLIQSAQEFAPSFALVGLASAVGVLFLRAARWEKPPVLPGEPNEPAPED